MSPMKSYEESRVARRVILRHKRDPSSVRRAGRIWPKPSNPRRYCTPTGSSTRMLLVFRSVNTFAASMIGDVDAFAASTIGDVGTLGSSTAEDDRSVIFSRGDINFGAALCNEDIASAYSNMPGECGLAVSFGAAFVCRKSLGGR